MQNTRQGTNFSVFNACDSFVKSGFETYCAERVDGVDRVFGLPTVARMSRNLADASTGNNGEQTRSDVDMSFVKKVSNMTGKQTNLTGLNFRRGARCTKGVPAKWFSTTTRLPPTQLIAIVCSTRFHSLRRSSISFTTSARATSLKR